MEGIIMLNDIPYKDIVNKGRKYNVWLLRDVHNNTFGDIAKEYGISVAAIVSDYHKILFWKLRYYVNHLSVMYGYKDTTHFGKIQNNARNCYCGEKYIVAYFEKEYADILNEYRGGEPGMPEQILRDLPPLRNRFSKQTISSVIRLRETNGMTYAAIGKRLHMTKEKAQDLYNRYYYNLYYLLSEKLIEITGNKDVRRKYQNAFYVGNGKKKYDCLLNDYPDLCKNIMEQNKRKQAKAR